MFSRQVQFGITNKYEKFHLRGWLVWVVMKAPQMKKKELQHSYHKQLVKSYILVRLNQNYRAWEGHCRPDRAVYKQHITPSHEGKAPGRWEESPSVTGTPALQQQWHQQQDHLGKRLQNCRRKVEDQGNERRLCFFCHLPLEGWLKGKKKLAQKIHVFLLWYYYRPT